ncbi:carboxypeptidase-like regulatory domain-containing protein, partial [Winogradskyella psychrotolerans]
NKTPMKNKLLLKGMVSFFFIYLLINEEIKAQEPVVQGTVTSTEDGEAIIGATLLLQDDLNSSRGTVTDINGKYSLSVQGPESTMVISSIGYISQTIKVGNRSEINIQLDPEVSELSEVVVTAFWD